MSLGIQRIQLPGIKKIIGVLGGKGGVGKTFIATNLAFTLAKSGKRIGLLDADICCPNVFKMLGITEKFTPTADKKIIPAEKWAVKVVSMAGLCNSDDEAIVWRGPIISKILQQLLRETIWGELDVLIVDFPTGTSDIALTILQNFETDGVLIISTPQETALLDTRKTINMVSLLRVPILGLVENMRGEMFGEGGVARSAQTYQLPFLGSIPLRKQIVSLCDQGTPSVMNVEEIEIIFAKIARVVMETVLQ